MKHLQSVPPQVDRSGWGSPGRFIDRLQRQLKKIGIAIETLDHKTAHSGHTAPPCFRMADTSYPAWLEQASLSYETVPYRLSMPAEPNYCRDCTPAFHAEMKVLNACIFPGTTFEQSKILGEPEITGVSRSQEVDPQTYPLYSDLTHTRSGTCLTENVTSLSSPPSTSTASVDAAPDSTCPSSPSP